MRKVFLLLTIGLTAAIALAATGLIVVSTGPGSAGKPTMVKASVTWQCGVCFSRTVSTFDGYASEFPVVCSRCGAHYRVLIQE